eukprot:gene24817-biopygen21453
MGLSDPYRKQIYRLAQTTSTQTFSYTGAVQNFIVPSGVTSITANLYGAASGTGGGGTQGYGAQMITTLSVTPGSTLYVYVGGIGATSVSGFWNLGGFNGGGQGYYGSGGGGSSDIRNVDSISYRLAVAGGGGGTYYSGCAGSNGGSGGTPNGAAGSAGNCGGTGGGGGTQSSGGTPTGDGGAGSFYYGGNGGTSGSCGGGGGYYGGASGSSGSGGGGGSSYSAV